MEIYCDGSGFNGRVSRYCVYYNGQVILEELPEKKTCNEMEYFALITALEYARTNDTIFSDSELIVKQIKGEYAIKAENLKVLHTKAVNLVQYKTITVLWIPRHKNKAG